MAGQRIGYVRVSSLDHDAKRQLDGQVLDREGDTVVVHSMDRLCRNLDDLRIPPWPTPCSPSWVPSPNSNAPSSGNARGKHRPGQAARRL